jgi:hypothetical protein
LSDSKVSESYEGKKKSQTWKKSSITNLCSKYSNSLASSDKDEMPWKKDDSSATTNNSTLSFHIAAFENSNEASSLNSQRSWLIHKQKQINAASTFVSQVKLNYVKSFVYFLYC